MMEATEQAVRRDITVNAPPERAFAVFTERMDTWWPRSHKIGAADLDKVVVEPREGGRWYELGVDGSECVWGEVLAYDPPNRLVLTWRIAGDWQLDEGASEIEVTFTPWATAPASRSSTATSSGCASATRCASRSAAKAAGAGCWRPTPRRSDS